MYGCIVCNSEHPTRDTLQFLFTRSKPLEGSTEIVQFSWVVCKQVCADKVRNDPETATVIVDESFAG